MTAAPSIPPAEYAARRRKLLTALKKSVGVLMAGPAGPGLDERYRPHPHFEYLTGVVDEPGAVLVLDPANPVEARREVLFLPPLNPEREQWDGLRLRIGQALRDRTGVRTVHRLDQLPRVLNEASRRARSLACLHPLAAHDRPVSPDLELFHAIARRVPGTEIIDRTEAVARLRSIKSAREVAMIQGAIDVTRTGFAAALAAMRPGLNEFDIQERVEHAYRTNGSRGPAFGTIVGSGINSTVLHYRANDRIIEAGSLVCIDSGAACGGYGADITRTIPADGRFTARQREVYEVVLAAEQAAIKAARPGRRLAEVDAVARAVITRAGFGDSFLHSIGHHLGLETHDVAPDAPLRPGNVVTIEPGVYLPDEALGVRIEDDVLITKDGSRNLSAKIPKTIAQIEKAMARPRRK